MQYRMKNQHIKVISLLGLHLSHVEKLSLFAQKSGQIVSLLQMDQANHIGYILLFTEPKHS